MNTVIVRRTDKPNVIFSPLSGGNINLQQDEDTRVIAIFIFSVQLISVIQSDNRIYLFENLNYYFMKTASAWSFINT